ncbi:uncharacterized protein DUF4129 [Knoellia remsis]|uniref:Uncharacterized protein DUF4129 n=1 Tax=Knoellia remsis TaxID=407159 RepID=A0A2T0UEE4_9MICO|nr:DUF4129 domain-containing protein [Knoellia remsis]PRY56316.1 uncharacterized protein DUF4129 [Knoellia remsis]
MRTRRWLAGAGVLVALLLAGWVSASGTVTAFTTPEPNASPSKAYIETVPSDEVDPRSERPATAAEKEVADGVANLVAWTLRLLIALIVLVVLGLVVRALVRRLRRDVPTPKQDVRAGVLPDVLVAALDRSEAELDSGTSSEAVINAWLALEEAALASGLDDDRSRTPTELVAVVLANHDVDRDAIERLAALYREARFSVHPMEETHREAARDAVRQVRADLLEPLATTAPTGPGPR